MFNNFEFEKFTPEDEVRIYGNTMLFQTTDYVPDKFSSLATIKKEKGRFYCHLEIFAKSGLFTEESDAADPKSAIDAVDKKMRQHILDWRTKHYTLSSANFWNFKDVNLENTNWSA